MSDETRESAWPPLHPRNMHVTKVARAGMKHPRSARVTLRAEKEFANSPFQTLEGDFMEALF